MSQIISSVSRWTARIAAIGVAAAFLFFVLGEPLEPLRGIQPQDWMGMVLLFGAIVAMLLAWKWEFPAALISLFAIGAFASVVGMRRFDVLIILAVPNLLFLLDWKLRRSHFVGSNAH